MWISQLHIQNVNFQFLQHSKSAGIQFKLLDTDLVTDEAIEMQITCITYIVM